MFKFTNFLLVLICISNLNAAEVINAPNFDPQINSTASAIIYIGILNEIGVQRAIDLIDSKSPHELVINSRGGDVLAAMRLGLKIHSKKMDVVVDQKCNSSCANYIFPSGINKTIKVGSVVLWHGDARQKNFTNELLFLKNKSNMKNEQLSEKELKILKHRRDTINAQDDFYKKIGIDGSIARIGQEIPNLEKRAALWTVNLNTMYLFDINNVSAPIDYGTVEFCNYWFPSNVDKKNKFVKCLNFSEIEINNWKMLGN